MLQLRAEDEYGNVHTTWCDHRHPNRKSALNECKSFFPVEDGYRKHRAMTRAEIEREMECEDPPFSAAPASLREGAMDLPAGKTPLRSKRNRNEGEQAATLIAQAEEPATRRTETDPREIR
jgi:hypothetical protein